MKMKLLVTSIAIGFAATSAFAATPMANNSNKGSLLIFPKIQAGPNAETIVTLVNDSSAPVRLKCFYATSYPDVPTPNTQPNTSTAIRGLKHKVDFTIDLTHNMPVAFYASTGQLVGNSSLRAGSIAPPFGVYLDGANVPPTGELKCWAVTDDYQAERHWNHLFGTASIMNTQTLQAWEYTAWAFQAQGPSTDTGIALGSPGELRLNNVEYDACPAILVGDFIAGGSPNPFGNPNTRITLASCNQDLRQAYTPTISKLTYTFWNQDEMNRTSAHQCADSWYEAYFPAVTWSPATQYAYLGTAAAYFKIVPTADTQICGPSAVVSSYVGVKSEDFAGGYVRGTNLTGRGQASGTILYDIPGADTYKGL